jgi:integrase
MVLSMPSPFKHSSTGVYWYRQRVPARLKSVAKGKSVTVTIDGYSSSPTLGSDIKVSLRTKSPAEAKRLAVEAQSEFDRVWLSLETGPVQLTLKQITALAGEMYHTIRAVLEDDPGEAAQWAQRRRDRINADRQRASSAMPRLLIPTPSLEARLGSWVDGALAEHHLVVDENTRQRMLIEFDRAVGDVALLLERRGQGDFTEDAVGKRFPSFAPAPVTAARSASGGASLTQLVQVWSNRLQKPKTQTIKGYSSLLLQFSAFLGHEDAASVTAADIVRWHDSLVRPGTITHETFIKKHRAAVGTVYTYAMGEMGRVALQALGVTPPQLNPARVKLEGEKRVVGRPKHFTREEAVRILRCAMLAEDVENGFEPYNRAAQRWVPWLAAYTGARPGELCQLRAEDFKEIDGIKCVALLPDAGTIKTRKYRYVPLHPHLIDMGVWKFASRSSSGPLFYNHHLTSEQPWVQTVQMLGEWVREVAQVTDKRVRPNHAWRHWFKSKGRTAGIDDAYLDVICGQVLPTAGRNYGEYEPAALLREIVKLPVISLDG